METGLLHVNSLYFVYFMQIKSCLILLIIDCAYIDLYKYNFNRC